MVYFVKALRRISWLGQFETMKDSRMVEVSETGDYMEGGAEPGKDGFTMPLELSLIHI